MNSPSDVAQTYFNAWNEHDADSIAKLFTDNGEYRDPGIKIWGRDVGTYAKELWDAFPDLSFEIISKTESAGD